MFEDVSNLFIEEAVFFINFFQFISGMPKTCYAFNYYTLCKKIEVKDSAIEFLKEQGILKTSVKFKCGCDLATIKQRTGMGDYYFCCAKCDSTTSIMLLLLILHL